MGRSHELEALKAQLLNSDARAIATTSVCIIGFAGIGKTTLTSQLVRQLQKENSPFVIATWESLRSATGTAPRFDGIIDSLLYTLSNGEITAAFTVQDDYLKKTERLVKLLKDKPCLVVLDNVETVLKTGQAAGAGYFANNCAEYASEYPLSGAGIAAQMPEVSEYDLKEKIILALKRRQLLDYDQKQESYQLHPLIQEKAYMFQSNQASAISNSFLAQKFISCCDSSAG